MTDMNRFFLYLSLSPVRVGDMRRALECQIKKKKKNDSRLTENVIHCTYRKREDNFHLNSCSHMFWERIDTLAIDNEIALI